MKITLIGVGKIKEKYLTEAIHEYSKRLGRYCTLQIAEVADESAPENAGELMQEKIRMREGERILGRIPASAHVIALAIRGKKYDSEGLAAHIAGLQVSGCSELCFVIGGSLGLSQQVLARADEQISFSDLTFPHQLMRVILLEQIYRCFRINRNEPYHK